MNLPIFRVSLDMEVASLGGVVRMVLILLAIYILVRLLGRLLQPFMTNQSTRDERRPNRKEGDVTIEYTDKSKKNKKNGDSGEGDYIDFEELD
jgi:hypothetical protein